MIQGPAPLVATPLAPIPNGGSAEWFEGEGGVRLRAALFPADAPRGSVVLSPGRTEPIEKYFEVVDELRGRGLSVLVHDWRGQGLSQRLHADPLRGHADGTDAFLADYRRLLDAFEARLPRPWIALGHSMGGALTAAAVAAGEARLAGVVLSAPMMGVQLMGAPFAVARAVSGLMGRAGCGGLYAIGKGDPLGGTFEANVLTHDRARWERTLALLNQAPELQLAGVTWSWLGFALELAARLRAVDALAIPAAVITAGEEKLVDNAASRAFAERTAARYVEIAGAYHEILMETDVVRAQVWAEFDAVAAGVFRTLG